MPLNTRSHSVELIDDNIYVFGGYNGSTPISAVQIYNIPNNTWSRLSDMDTTFRDGVSLTVDNKIYLIGGAEKPKGLKVYNPQTNTFDNKSESNENHQFSTAEVVDGKIYVFGGYNTEGYSDIIECYDPKTDSWSIVGNMLFKTGYHSSVTLGEKIYLIGGRDEDGYSKKIQCFDTSTGEIVFLTEMPGTRTQHHSILYNNKIYIFGGRGVDSNVTRVYDIESNTWSEGYNMLINRRFSSSVIKDSTVYIIGGFNDDSNSFISQVDKFDINKFESINSVFEAQSKTEIKYIEKARMQVNRLKESILKDLLQERLNNISSISDLNINNKITTSNTDIYIKMNNYISLSLSTNSIVFEDISLVKDYENSNALSLTVNSSLPYKINSYLEEEIYNSDKTYTIPSTALNIKDNKSDIYNTFTHINKPVILVDNQNGGMNITHNIDLKFSALNAYKIDTYKSVIKFEAEQK